MTQVQRFAAGGSRAILKQVVSRAVIDVFSEAVAVGLAGETDIQGDGCSIWDLFVQLV